MEQFEKKSDSFDQDPGGGEVFVFPASSAQRRLWFLDQIDPGNSAYNLPVWIRCAGRLDTLALRRSLEAVIDRHEVLRTTFSLLDDEPVQVVSPPRPAELPVVDLRGVSGGEVWARELMEAEARRPFDLARGPLIRALLLRLGEEDWL